MLSWQGSDDGLAMMTLVVKEGDLDEEVAVLTRCQWQSRRVVLKAGLLAAVNEGVDEGLMMSKSESQDLCDVSGGEDDRVVVKMRAAGGNGVEKGSQGRQQRGEGQCC